MTLLVTVDEECDAAGAQHYVALRTGGGSTPAAWPPSPRACRSSRRAGEQPISGSRSPAPAPHAGNPGRRRERDPRRERRDRHDRGRRRRPAVPPRIRNSAGRAGTWGRSAAVTETSIVADQCELALDRRTLPGEDPRHDPVRDPGPVHAGPCAGRSRAGAERISLTGSIDMIMPGFRDGPRGRLRGRMPGRGAACWWQRRDRGMDGPRARGGFVNRVHQIPTVVLGPGDVNNQAHQPDESVEIPELLEAARTYALIALRSSKSMTT
jgi:succinyl-diaminopimelate desuccinylase